jgi:hypothetical protein
VIYDAVLLFSAFILATFAVARAARLLVYDDMPLFKNVREWWVRHTGQWGTLFLCQFCMTPYLAAGDLAWALTTRINWFTFWGAAWWVVNGWAAMSYIAAMVVSRDEPPEET